MLRLPIVGVLLSLSAIAIGACGSSSPKPTVTASGVLDPKPIERAIAHSIVTQRHVRAYVTCPSGVPQMKGVTFVCLAVTRFGTTSFTVTQDNSYGHVVYRAQ